jgi:hypothetical protein
MSLEQVPETGRWRYMNVRPEYEAKVRAGSRPRSGCA